jgi:hypothetical protein
MASEVSDIVKRCGNENREQKEITLIACPFMGRWRTREVGNKGTWGFGNKGTWGFVIVCKIALYCNNL